MSTVDFLEADRMLEPRSHPFYALHRLANGIFRSGLTDFLHKWIKFPADILAWCTVFVLPFLKLIDTWKSNTPTTTFDLAVTWLSNHQPAIITVLLGLQAAARVALTLINRFKPTNTALLGKAMDTIVSVLMKENDKERERYRATLFVPRGLPFLGRWLGIAARSGHMHLKSNTIFSINEEDLSKNTGVAGHCFSTGNTVKRLEMPYPDCDLKNQQQVAGNARYLYSTEREFRSLRLKNCRFYLATCIKVRGKIRGVLVLDSTDPAAAAATIDEDQFKSILNHTAQMLSLILEDKGEAK